MNPAPASILLLASLSATVRARPDGVAELRRPALDELTAPGEDEDLAERVGLSAAGARRRVLRLIDARVVRIGAVVRHHGQDRQSAMGFGIRLVGAHRDVVAALTGMPSVIFLARTLGRFDILATVRAFSAAQLVEVLDAVRALPGVRKVAARMRAASQPISARPKTTRT